MTTEQTERSTGGRIEVVGNIWHPGVGVCAMTYNLRSYDVGNMRGRMVVGVMGIPHASITRRRRQLVPFPLPFRLAGRLASRVWTEELVSMADASLKRQVEEAVSREQGTEDE